MKAMILDRICHLRENRHPLRLVEREVPEPRKHEVLIQTSACGVCHTELDEIEGRTPPSFFPVIPGHQIVGTVVAGGRDVTRIRTGERVGVAWVFHACGTCEQCLSGAENLCDHFLATGRDAHGGYAEFVTVSEDFVHPIPKTLSDVQAAPLLCAGAIGYRSLMLTGLENGQRLGLTGFGASAHLVLKMVRHRFPDTKVYVFARKESERSFALQLGARWAGNTDAQAPEQLHAVIDTTPAWKPVVEALKNLQCGGRLVINAIRKEPDDQEYLLRIDYPSHLWMEKEIKSVANVTRRDVRECLELAGDIPILPEVQEFDLVDANRALLELKDGNIRGAKVLRMTGG